MFTTAPAGALAASAAVDRPSNVPISNSCTGARSRTTRQSTSSSRSDTFPSLPSGKGSWTSVVSREMASMPTSGSSGRGYSAYPASRARREMTARRLGDRSPSVNVCVAYASAEA